MYSGFIIIKRRIYGPCMAKQPCFSEGQNEMINTAVENRMMTLNKSFICSCYKPDKHEGPILTDSQARVIIKTSCAQKRVLFTEKTLHVLQK